MTTIDTKHLRALAEAAGPFVRYELDDPNPCFIAGSDPGDDSAQIVIGDVYDGRVAEYIAAADPQTMIALLDEIERLRGEGEWEYSLADDGAVEPYSDYSTDLDWILDGVHPLDEGTVLLRRRKAGPWEPVEGEK